MRKTNKKILSFVMAMLTLITTVFGHVDYTAYADEATNTTYTKVTDSADFTSGSYVMLVGTNYSPTKYSDGWVLVEELTVSGETLTSGTAWTLTVDATAKTVKITDSAGNTLAPKGGNTNGITAGDYSWAWTCTDGTFRFDGSGTDTVTLASNTGSNGQIRAYKNNNSSGFPCDFTLYKASESGTTTPDTEAPDTTVPGTGSTENTENTGSTENTQTTESTEGAEVTISTIANALAASEGTELTVKGVVTLVDGKNIYVQDETDAMGLYMTSAPSDISLGDTIIATGTRGSYSGLQQLASATYEKSTGLTLTAKKTTLGALTSEDVASYVELENLTVSSISGSNTILTDGTNTMPLYKAVTGDVTLAVGDVINLKASVGIYNSLQLRNTLASEITVVSKADTDEGTEVTVSTIEEALAGAEGTSFTVKGVVTLVDGKNIYVQDATGAICVRMSSTPSDIALGDTIIGTGSKTVYNGLPQLGSGTYEKSEGLTLEAKVTTIGELTTADIATYVSIMDVEVTEVYDNNGSYSTPNITVSDGTNSIQLYKAVIGKTDDAWDVQVGDYINIKAAVSAYNTTLQLRNTLATEITEGDKCDKISAALAGAEDEEFTVKGVVTLLDGKNIYVQDSTGAICIYVSTKPTDLELGDTIVATGKKTEYKGLPELASATYEKSEGLVLKAKETIIGALTTSDIATYISLKNVEVTEVYDNNGTYSTPNITVTDGKDSIQLYKAVIGKTDDAWDVQVGDVINITAAVGVYNTTLQLRNTLATEVTKGVKVGKVTSADDLTSGAYVMVVETGYAPVALDGSWLTTTKPVIAGGKVTAAKGSIWTLTVDGTNVKLTDSSSTTVAPKGGNNNGIKSGDYNWTWTFDEETQTFQFAGQGSDTVLLASNTGSENKFRGYKTSTVSGNAATYPCNFTLYHVDPDMVDAESNGPVDGSKVVIYNLSAKGVLAAQDDNTESPSIENVSATETDGIATASNGAVIFEVRANGDYLRFYNETYGYLCSGGTGNNAYYSLEACDEADWKLEAIDDAYLMISKVAKFNGQYAQYLEYYAGAYKTYSHYNVTDESIYSFKFLECANEKLTGGIVNEPAAVTEDLLPAYVGVEYSFTFEVDAPFGVKELAVTLGKEALEYTENSGIYTVTIPVEKISGEKLEIVVSGKDTKDVAFTSTITITVKDEPAITDVTPASGSETGDNKKPVISAMIGNAGENPTVTMTVNGEEVDAAYADGKISYTPAKALEDGRCSVTVTVTRADGKTASKTWSFTVGEAQYQLYFGQLHSHTTYSDGSGSLSSALDYIKNLPDSAKVDFVAFTDHSNYFDEKSSANPEGALYDMNLASADSQATWAEYKKTVADFNEANAGDVVAIAGFEMTWSGGPGHMNTFNTAGIVSRNNSTLNNKTNDAGMKAYYALLSQTEGADSISQFNHPGSTFGTFTDFSYWDAVVDTRISLVEVGNGEGAVGAGGYFPSYEYYTMALDKGWHVAPTNNQDNHKGKWGNANEARDVILTDNFTEEGIYQAMRDMRMYATEDKNLEIYYTVNGYQLGSSITEVPEKLDINVSVYDPDASDSISKVEVIVNSGKTAYTWDSQEELSAGSLSCTLDPSYSYYYIRVTEGDGDLAVTAPVWVGESLKLGISSVECGTSTPVTDEEVTITTTLFNSENANATVKSLTYTVNGSEVIGTDTTGYTISASGTLPVEFKYVPTAAKVTKITVTAVVEQDGIEYTFSMDVTLDIQDATKLVYIGIDAAHYNEYVAGNYADSMGNFGELAAGYSVRTVELKTSEDLIAACSNDKYKALILTAPSRRLTAAHTDPRTYSADEIAAIVKFNENGGTVILAGWSDFYEEPSKTNNNTGVAFKHMAATQNEVLEALGSSLRISDDATYDDSYNGGQQYRLYFNTYGENFLTEGVEVDPENLHDRMYTEVFSHYGGASIYVVDESGKATSTIPATVSPVVYGHSTTYSVDADNDGLGASTIPKYTYAEGDNRLMAMAMEEIEGKGAIIVSGAAFMSNFEVQATIEDSGSEKNYSNYRICENLVQYLNPVAITPISEVQAQTEVGYKYTIEGIVTSNASGYDKDTAFFDCIYVQDATGGVCCFPVAGEYKIGDKVRVTGTTEFYQGEMELQVTDIEVIGTGTVTPKTVTASQVNDGSVLGQLITVSGTIVSFEKANGLVQTIMVKDAAGNVCRVFIDGYITTDADVKKVAVGNAITVTGLASYDDTFNAPDGPFPRIRIRDREDVVCYEVYRPSTPDYDEEETTTPSTETTKPSTKPSTTETPVDSETVEETVTTPVTTPEIKVDEALTEAAQTQTDALVEAVKSGEVAEGSVSEETLENIKAAVEAGEEIITEVVTDMVEEKEVASEDKAAMEEGLKAIENVAFEVLQYFDLSVVIKTESGKELGTYDELPAPLTFTITVPTEMLEAGKDIVVIRVHNGVVEVLDTAMNADGTVSFATDRFSVYALAYKEDVAVESDPVEDKVPETEAATDATNDAATEEGGSSMGIILVIVAGLAVAILVAVSVLKKRK